MCKPVLTLYTNTGKKKLTLLNIRGRVRGILQHFYVDDLIGHIGSEILKITV